MVASARTKSAGFAASAPTSKPAASSEAVVPLAVVNLGLSTAQARNVQCWLKANWGYTGALDGQLGTNSWKAFQRNLRTYWGYTGAIDGIVGSGTVKALQRLLKDSWGYTGARVCTCIGASCSSSPTHCPDLLSGSGSILTRKIRTHERRRRRGTHGGWWRGARRSAGAS
jgi:hypothetical protein